MTPQLLGDIDFGPKDARHAFVSGEEAEDIFEKIFIDPIGLNVESFLQGRKNFVYGIKGAGKSAYLRHIDIKARQRGFSTTFLYFSDHTENKDDKKSFGIGVSGKAAREAGNYEEYWNTFILLAIGQRLYERDAIQASGYFKFLAKQTDEKYAGYLSTFLSRVPIFRNFLLGLSGKSFDAKIEGDFKQIASFHEFFENAFDHLRAATVETPILILIDELEVSFQTRQQFDKDVELAGSLIRSIRNLCERFRKENIPAYIVAAIRKEAAAKVSGGDAHKIISDLGDEIAWDDANRDGKHHPLFQIALNRIAFSSNSHHKAGRPDFKAIIETTMPFYRGRQTEREILDLTTYRPRDISILFKEAAKLDRRRTSFQKDTFLKSCRRKYREELWADFAEALQFSYTQPQVDIFGQVFNSQKSRFNFEEFKQTFDDFSADPNVAEIIDTFDAKQWANILKELYELGAIGYFREDRNGKPIQAFHYRGQTEPLILRSGLTLIKTKGLETA